MRKKFLTNLLLLISLNLLVKPLWIFGIDRTVQNVVGSADYGFYFSIFNFAFLFNILLDAGITNFNNRNIARHHQLLNKHLSGIIVLKFLLALVYILAIYCIALIIGYNASQLKLLGWIGFNQLLLSFILYLRSNISGLLLFRTDSVVSVLDRVLMILICSVLLWGGVTGREFRIEWFVYAQTAAYLMTAAVAMAIVARKARFRRLKWDLPFFLVIIKRSFPFALLVLLMSVYNRVDAVFIERLLGDQLGYEQAGIYAQAYRLFDAANQFALLFAVLLLPIYSRMLRQKENLEEMVRLPFSLLFVFGMIAAAASFFFSEEIMELLYPARAGESMADFALRVGTSSQVFGIIMFGFLGTCAMYVFSTLLTAGGNLRQLNLAALAGIIINFTLNIWLIPKFMAVGASVASLVTQLLTAAVYVFLVQYFYRFRPNYKFLVSLVIYAAVAMACGHLVHSAPFHWLLSLGLYVAFLLILAGVLGLLSPKAILFILREKE